MPKPPVINRIAEPVYDRLSDEQRAIYDTIAGGPRGGVRGPLAVWLHRPQLAQRAQHLGEYCRYGSTLPARLSELAILVMAVEWDAAYEWVAHEPHARKAGLADAVIDSLRAGEEPAFQQRDEALVYRFVRTLIRDKAVPETLYREAEAELGSATLVDLVGIAGYYTLISMTIKAFDVVPAAEDAR